MYVCMYIYICVDKYKYIYIYIHRYGVANHFLTKSTNGNKVENIEVQLTEQVQEGKRVILILKVVCSVERSVGKPRVLLYLME